jgi:ABC-type molybdate transport system substrate-binding protein
VESTSIVVEYPVAVVGEKAHYQKTISFLEYLTSDESSEIFSKFGFEFLE